VLPSWPRIWAIRPPTADPAVSPAREASSDTVTVVRYSVVGTPFRSTWPTVVTWPPIDDSRPSSCDGLDSTARVDESALDEVAPWGRPAFNQVGPPVSEDRAGEPR